MKQIFKNTYPTGKNYIGKDLQGRMDYFGAPDSKILAEDFESLPKSQRNDYSVRKRTLWESRDCSEQTLAAKKVELIKQYQSYKPNIGYNHSTATFDDRKQCDTSCRIGVDGCKAGWFYVAIFGESYEFGIVETLEQLFNIYDVIEEIIVDIPIGLFDSGASPRVCNASRKFKIRWS